jgi:hypothetical protein
MNQGQQTGPFFRLDRTADRFPSPDRCRPLLPRKVLAFVRPTRPFWFENAANQIDGDYRKVGKHSYSDCQKVGETCSKQCKHDHHDHTAAK